MHQNKTRQFIMSVLQAPNVPYAQMMIDQYVPTLDKEFFQILDALIREMSMRSLSFSSRYRPGASCGYINGLAGGAQKAQHYYRGLLMLKEYAHQIVEQRQLAYAGMDAEHDDMDQTYDELDETYEPYEGYEDEEYYTDFERDGYSEYEDYKVLAS